LAGYSLGRDCLSSGAIGTLAGEGIDVAIVDRTSSPDRRGTTTFARSCPQSGAAIRIENRIGAGFDGESVIGSPLVFSKDARRCLETSRWLRPRRRRLARLLSPALGERACTASVGKDI
jgi:hypothetical protein